MAAHPDSERHEMKIGSLFSGTGMLDVAVESVIPGAHTVWHCEWEDAPAKILAHHWPDIPNFRDVTQVEWSQVEPVDIITGGSPCPDLSLAGKRAGMTEGTRSNLWVNMREAVNQLHPKFVVWENVRGALSAAATSESDMEPGTGPLGNAREGHLRALGRVLGDLTELGYDARWATVRASDAGAPHTRARVFLIAYPADTPGSGREGQAVAGVQQGEPADRGGETLSDTDSIGRERGGEARHGGSRSADGSGGDVDWGRYGPAVRRWEDLTRPAPAPTEPNRNGKPRLNAAFAEWMMGIPAGHVTSEEIGIPRTKQLAAIGNGVCPQQAILALRHLFSERARAE